MSDSYLEEQNEPKTAASPTAHTNMGDRNSTIHSSRSWFPASAIKTISTDLHTAQTEKSLSSVEAVFSGDFRLWQVDIYKYPVYHT